MFGGTFTIPSHCMMVFFSILEKVSLFEFDENKGYTVFNAKLKDLAHRMAEFKDV